jgi:uncharacterized membrane protein YhaH (DUF805 family)
MNFTTSISTCFSKYATFSGRASRSEFWWFNLFAVLASWAGSFVGAILFDGGELFGNLISLALMIPLLAVGSRRLHDTGRSGWWQLLFITLIGILLLIVWFAFDSEKSSNKYGEYSA